MLSKEKIRGFIVENSCVWDNIEIIPAVWAYMIVNKLEDEKRIGLIHPPITPIWKEKLTIKEKNSFLQNSRLQVFDQYKKMEKSALEDWYSFCEEWEKLKCESPRSIQSVIPFLVRSIPENKYNQYYVWYDGTWVSGLVPIYSVESPLNIKNAIKENELIWNILNYGSPENPCLKEGWLSLKIIPLGQVDDVCKVGVRQHPELEKYLMEKFPGRVCSLSGLPESWNTVPADPGAAAAESAPASVPSLVGPGSAPAVAAAGSVSAVADTAPTAAAAESAPVDLWADIFGLAPVSQAEKVEAAPAAVSSLVRPGSAPAAADTVPADPAAVPVVAAADPAPVAQADSSKRKKRTEITPNLIEDVAEYAARNPGATYKDIAKHFDLSDEVFRPGKKPRKAVDLARTGDLGRHAAKPDKPFNYDN